MIMGNINKICGKIMIKSPWEDMDTNTKKPNPFRPKTQFSPPNMNFDAKTALLAVFAALILWLSSGIYKVQEGEEALVLRFGQYVRKATSGLNYHLPSPIETVIIERVNKSRRAEIGYRSNQMGSGSTYLLAESTMLTGDENIVDLNCDVMWHIKDLNNFFFKVVDPTDTVKTAAESAIREVIGETPITSVLSNRKQEIVDKVEILTQAILDLYNTGVEIEQVQLLKAEPPVEVIDAYRDVQTSKADKERLINQALAYQNDILPRARGQAAKVLEEAHAYKQEVISRSEGDTHRFLALLRQYKSSKKVMRDRLYLNTIEKVLNNNDTLIVGADLLPLMDISKVNNKFMGQ